MASKLMAVNEYGQPVGEDHGKAKLTDKEVIAIREERRELGTSYGVMAKRYKCAKSTIRDICTGKRRNTLAAQYVKRKMRRR